MNKWLEKYRIIILTIILVFSLFLRVWRIDKVPVSLFGDELDLGYQALSILKTGEDYSGNKWPLNFQSLAEWRTPLYLYSAVPTVAIFGISPLGVRLPAAIFGIIGILGFYLLLKEITQKEGFALLGSLFLAISPWDIQYSRGGFEVTELIAFLIFGIYFYLKSFKNSKFLPWSVGFIVITPLIYSTAKLFGPLLLIFLFLINRKEILHFKKKVLISVVITGLIIGIPVSYATLVGGGTSRFDYISVFSDPTIEPSIGVARQRDAAMRGELTLGTKPTPIDRLFHNKFTYEIPLVINNYIKTFSTNFLFISGDPILRHSINTEGEFYKIEAIALILGLILFFTHFKDKKVKILIAFWIILGALPAALTRDGGNHATRLILILPPLMFLVTYGFCEFALLLKGKSKLIFVTSYFLLLALCFIFYEHNYWVHYPWDSERIWHAGFKESFQEIEKVQGNYNKVVISMAGEPAWIFFAGWMQYPPDLWHKGYPFKKQTLNGFGEVSYIDKYYFGAFHSKEGIYSLPNYIDKNTLYLAVSTEIGANLITEPQRTPPGLKLVKAIAFPSGEPAYYLFAKQ